MAGLALSLTALPEDVVCHAVLLERAALCNGGQTLAVQCAALVVHARINARGISHERFFRHVHLLKKRLHIKLRNEPERGEYGRHIRGKILRRRGLFKLCAELAEPYYQRRPHSGGEEVQLPSRQNGYALKAL